MTKDEVDSAFGARADLIDQWDEVEEFNQQLCAVFRATTEGVPFDLVESASPGSGLWAWRMLRKKYDPATGGRKRVMLQALTNPERASYETLGRGGKACGAGTTRRRTSSGALGDLAGLPGDECPGEVGPQGSGNPPAAELL